MKKIAIIGAGISGLYLANLFQKNTNFQYTIYEKRSQFDFNDGYGIQLSVNSVKLLNNIDFKNITEHELAFPKKVNFFDAKTIREICSIDIEKFNTANVRYTTLKRSSLIKFLLSNIPKNKIKTNIELKNIEYNKKIKAFFSNNLIEEFDYLIVCDGVFSETKSIVLKKDVTPKFYNAIALRGNIKNYNNNDISLFLGSNFHYVIYPINQNNEFNFISIIRKKLNKNELINQDLYNDKDYLASLTDGIYTKTSLELDGKIENIKSFPIYVSKKFEISKRKNIYFVGDALFAYPPSFAQGASQSIEASNELFDEINNNTNHYYKNRLKKLKAVNFRSQLNQFVFHFSNPLIIYLRNAMLKVLVKNKKFLDIYLGNIYRF